jgi:bifunctional non-homologous end joining protein LigD
MDLDPAAGLPWKRVVEAARDVRERLAADGLKSFVKTTGGKGLHVVVPLTGAITWDDVRDYTRAVAEAMERDDPKLYTANMRKASRENRVFIDHLRNGRGATAVAPYSMRAKDGCVAVPVAWDELPDIRGNTWSVLNLHERLTTTKDPWKGYFDVKQTLPNLRSRPEKFG